MIIMILEDDTALCKTEARLLQLIYATGSPATKQLAGKASNKGYTIKIRIYIFVSIKRFIDLTLHI